MPLDGYADFKRYTKEQFNENSQVELAEIFHILSKRKVKMLLTNSNTPLIDELYTGFDRKVIENLRRINDPYPYFRGLIYEISNKIEFLTFKQPLRRAGETKNNFYTLYDIAMLGIIKHSKVPIRFLTIFGMFLSFLSIIFAIFYFFMKIIFWEKFQMGIAPLVIGIFSFGAFQILFLGIIGEYILNINTQTRNLPLVIEKERVNFD